MAPFQHLSRPAVQFQSPTWPRGQILQPLVCVDHTPGLFGDQRCNVLSQNKSQGSVWALSGSPATAYSEGPFPWRGKAPSSPALASAWVTYSWPGGGKDRCHLGCSRRSGRAGDGEIPSDSHQPLLGLQLWSHFAMCPQKMCPQHPQPPPLQS